MFKILIKFKDEVVQSRAEAETEKKLEPLAAVIVEKLEAATPVDTGEARDAWSSHKTGSTSFEVTNTAEHIVFLNAGTSQQAPAYFIESIALQHGKAKGPIVVKK